MSVTGRENDQPGGTGGLIVSGPHHVLPPRSKTQPSIATRQLGEGGTTTTTAPNPKLPTAANPLRVLIAGDSIGLDMGGTSTDVAFQSLARASHAARTGPIYVAGHPIAVPSLDSCRSSIVSTSVTEKQSCTSTSDTCSRGLLMPASL